MPRPSKSLSQNVDEPRASARAALRKPAVGAGSKSSKPRRAPRSGTSSTTDGFRQTRRDHASEVAQDYVELIDDLIRECGEARLVDIAGRMGVSHVTASKAVGRLQRDGLVRRRPYRAIFLTEKGKRLADRSRRRHQIVYACLRALGVPEHRARIDAEGIEHHISDVTLRAMSKFIDAIPGGDKDRP